MSGLAFSGSGAAEADAGGMTLHDRIQLEGDPWYSGSTAGPVTLTTAAGGLGAISLPGASFAFWIDNITFSSNKAIDGQIAGTVGASTNIGWYYRFIAGPYTQVVLPVNQLVRPAHLAAASNGLIASGWARAILDADPTNAYLALRAHGTAIYDDLNFSAAHNVVVIGDSISRGTAGVTAKTKSWEWITREWFHDQGQDVRVINRSQSGTDSTFVERWRTQGVYEFDRPPSLIVYAVGANDAANAVPLATYSANLAAFIEWRRRRYPDTKLLILGSSPMENNTAETAAVAMRSAAEAQAAAAGVFFCSLGAAFDRTVAANYATSDTAGQRIHPSDAGHAAIAGVVTAFLAARGIEL